MINGFLEIIGNSFHIIIVAFLLGSILKSKYKTTGIWSVIIMTFTHCIRGAFISNFFLGSLMETLLLFLLVIILYESKLSKKILAFCILYLSLIIADSLTLLTLKLLFNYKISDLPSFPNMTGMIIGNIIFATVALLAVNAWHIATKNIAQNQMYLFMLFPVSQIYSLMIIYLLSAYYNNNALLTILFISVILCVLADAGLVIAMKKLTAVSIANEKLAFYEKQVELQLKHYEQLSEYSSIIRRYKHDIKNQIQTIYTLLGNKDINNAKKHADELSFSIDSAISTQFCDNLIVDALLQNKYLLAQKSKIKMDIIVQLGNKTGIDNLHLCSVFSNLIDNAVEACNKIPDSEVPPYIIIKCYEKAGFLIINVKNSKQNDILLSKNKKFLTTKKNTLEHGLGLTIVDNIAKMYNGDLCLNYDKNEFEAIVVLEIKPD